MRQLARCIAALLLAFLGSSCLATASVVEWAWEPEVRTEVLGYVESDAGASLIVSLEDWTTFDAGVYEVPVVPSDTKQLYTVAPASFAARRLGDAEFTEFQRARGASRRVGRLPGTYPWDDGSREHIDVFQRTNEGLRRAGPGAPRTFVALLPDRDSSSGSRSEGPKLAHVVVQRKEPGRKLTRVLGIAAIPPESIRAWRTVPAVCVLPATFAFDVITSPFQVVYVLHGLGESLGRMFESMSRNIVFPMILLCALLSPALPDAAQFGTVPFRELRSPSVASPIPVIVQSGVQWSWLMVWILSQCHLPQAQTPAPAN